MRGMDVARACRFATTAALGMLAGLAIVSAQPTPAMAQAASCAPAGNVKFICNANNVEDWAPIPGTHWVIGSDLAPAGQQGYLHLFNTPTTPCRMCNPTRLPSVRTRRAIRTVPARST